jgi:hypothetical protein
MKTLKTSYFYIFLLSFLAAADASAVQIVVRLLNEHPDPVSVSYSEGNFYRGGRILGAYEKSWTSNFPDDTTILFNTDDGLLSIGATFGYNAPRLKITADDIIKAVHPKPGQIVPICLYRSRWPGDIVSNAISSTIGSRNCWNRGLPEAETLLPFHSAVLTQNEGALRELLAITRPPASFNDADLNGDTVLHLAAKSRNPNLYRLLSDYAERSGLDTATLKNLDGYTPEELARGGPARRARIYNVTATNYFGIPLRVEVIKKDDSKSSISLGEQIEEVALGSSAEIKSLEATGTGLVQGSATRISWLDLDNCYDTLLASGAQSSGTMDIKLENDLATKLGIMWSCRFAEPLLYVESEKFALKLRNGNPYPIHVRIVEAKIPKDQGSVGFFGTLGGVFYNGLKGGTRTKSLRATTESQMIEPGSEITLQISKIGREQFRYVYWDTTPVADDGEGGYTLKGYFDLAPAISQGSRTIDITAKKVIMERGLDLIRARQPQADQPAFVESGSPESLPLMPAEHEALMNRERGKTAGAPRVGVCFSGGGLRAMFSALGFSIGLQDQGLLDSTSYAAGLSGSTWFLMKWLKDNRKSLVDIRRELVASMQKGLEPEEIDDESKIEKAKRAAEQLYLGTWYAPADDFRVQLAATRICPGGQCPSRLTYSVLDLWAYTLSRRVFTGEDKYQFTLSSLENDAQAGRLPLPLFTAIRTENDDEYARALEHWEASGGNRDEQPPRDYHWFEATPFSASFLAARKGEGATKTRIPTRALGRAFEGRESIKSSSQNFEPFIELGLRANGLYRPEPSAGQLIAAFGSAFSPTLAELKNLDWKVNAALTVAGKAGPILLAKLFGGTAKDWEEGYQKWLLPTNLAKGLFLNDFANGGNRQVELRDGGLFYNLPLPALFDPQRKLDVIIVNDASGDLHEKLGNELKKFATFAKDNGYYGGRLPHDLIDRNAFAAKLSTIERGSHLAVFNDPRERGFQRNQVTIIYVPTYHRGALDKMPTEKYGTFMLKYEERESNDLIDYNSELVRSVAKDVKAIIDARTVNVNH